MYTKRVVSRFKKHPTTSVDFILIALNYIDYKSILKIAEESKIFKINYKLFYFSINQ